LNVYFFTVAQVQCSVPLIYIYTQCYTRVLRIIIISIKYTFNLKKKSNVKCYSFFFFSFFFFFFFCRASCVIFSCNAMRDASHGNDFVSTFTIRSPVRLDTSMSKFVISKTFYYLKVIQNDFYILFI